MPERPLNVLIIGTGFDFPHGGGASSRIFWYAKGLAEAGDDVRIVSLAMPRRHACAAGAATSGTFEGLSYEYACGTRVRPDAFWRRRLLQARRAARSIDLVRQAVDRSSGGCVVLIYSEVSSWIVGLALAARLLGARSVQDLCEFPLVWRPRSLLTSLHRDLRMRLACHLVDAVVPISTYLDTYVHLYCDRAPTLRVPVMIDPGLFPQESDSAPDAAGRRVVYCGTLDHFGEIERAIRAFAEAAAGLDDVGLSLIGGGPRELRAKAESIARSVGVIDRVEFVHQLPRDALAARFAAAEVLVLPRAAGVFSQAGLPNKLGEYLASGRPVVATSNGDIPLYLQDGVNAYLVRPDDDAAFAARLRYVLTHRDEASAVGARGRVTATAEFDYRLHGARLHEFLKTSVMAHADADRGLSSSKGR